MIEEVNHEAAPAPINHIDEAVKQELLFEEDKRIREEATRSKAQQVELDRIEGLIRFKADEVKGKLKRCAGYMSLIKQGPQMVSDIFLRCQQNDLAARHLELLAEQANELQTEYQDCAKMILFIDDLEKQALPLREALNRPAGATLKAEEDEVEQHIREAELENEGTGLIEGEVEEDDLKNF